MSIVKDMALTRADFLRSLEVAMQGLDYRVEGGVVTAGLPERGITITISPLPPRRLSGLLSLPRAEVRISFHGYDEPEQAEFLSIFEKAYQRGGG
jgi:hypothetical protein